MSALAATLSANSLVDLAKKTMLPQGVRCQITSPGPCNAILVCWEAYRLHLLRQHSLTVKKIRDNDEQTGTSRTVTRKEWRCAFRCAHHVHLSRKSLEQHMISHMSKVPLCCPFQTCENLRPLESVFILIDHLDSSHHEQQILSPTELEGQLRATWWSLDSQPGGSFELPPWPDSPVDYLDIMNSHPSQPPSSSPPRTPPTSSPFRQFPRLVQSSALQSPSFNSPGRRPIPRQITIESIEDSDKPEEVFEFEDLPKSQCSPDHDSDWRPPPSQLHEDWIVWQRPHSWKKEAASPFHLQNAEDFNRMPPSSMDYNVFSARVDQLKAEGILGK
ncbi:hypothetical protein DFJ43DRAFT_1076943 [Lentinula guzmanii]|uniref:Uncharacterized protein n=1 Tax=Lentinula guzmanii TaxID=2804957 RepID=A0AA38MTG3_9AGAR|nr:hypothetical protein DFJ43DRAFT_1076943 [Lentinula guzmanii]